MYECGFATVYRNPGMKRGRPAAAPDIKCNDAAAYLPKL
jgi:hypothetical protein